MYFIKKLLKTNALKGYGASLNKKCFPGCENHTFDTREYWKCYVQHLTLTSYHPIGTCRMSDVVDKSFRYYLFDEIKIRTNENKRIKQLKRKININQM